MAVGRKQQSKMQRQGRSVLVLAAQTEPNYQHEWEAALDCVAQSGSPAKAGVRCTALALSTTQTIMDQHRARQSHVRLTGSKDAIRDGSYSQPLLMRQPCTPSLSPPSPLSPSLSPFLSLSLSLTHSLSLFRLTLIWRYVAS